MDLVSGKREATSTICEGPASVIGAGPIVRTYRLPPPAYPLFGSEPGRTGSCVGVRSTLDICASRLHLNIDVAREDGDASPAPPAPFLVRTS